jgi:glycosyltransferase involved in cell wall biosynthesis
VATVAVVSFRLGMSDGVSVETDKWTAAIRALGHDVSTVAGEGPVDTVVRGLEIGATSPPDPDELTEAIGDADAVVVENVCSLPLNVPASDAIASILRGRPAVLHHHDLPWQRAHLAHIDGPPDDPCWRHVTINALSGRQLAERGITSVEITNHFDLDPPAGNRVAMRAALGVRASATLVVQPMRAIPRKNVAAALRLAERLGAIYWIVGGAEDGFGPDLDRLLSSARTGVRQGLPDGFSVSDIYAAADVVAMTSTWEGFGNPTIESVAHRRPLARNRYPVMDEIEGHGFRFFDVDAVGALEKFIDRPDEELLDENLAVARSTYDLSLLPGELSALFTDLWNA